MPLQPRFIQILRALRRYFYLRTAQIRDLVIPHDKDGAMTRDCLRQLLALGHVRRHFPQMCEDGKQTAPPIFVLTQNGSCVLAEAMGDSRLVLLSEPMFRDWMSLNHFCAVSQVLMMIDAAMGAQSLATLHSLYLEHEIIDPAATDNSRKFRLHETVSNDPTIFCCPDAAFETEYKGYRRAWYIEKEMGSDTASRVAAKKHKGYALLSSQGFFRRHFPAARDMRVLAYCPNKSWMDLLRREMRGKPGADVWLFCSTPAVSIETFLHGSVFHTVEKGPLALVPAPAPAPGSPPAAERAPDRAPETVIGRK